MKRLISKTLSASTTSHLASRQATINGQVNFTAKAAQAGTAWNGKEGSQAGKDAFAEVKAVLIEMCVGVQGCNYCEGNEARDIEHIYPKSLFPERTFHWSNYLLACKTCNSGEKLDSFAVFNPAMSAIVYEVPRGAQPPNDDGVLIDPRSENPEDYLWLDIQGRTFHFTPYPIDDPQIATRYERRATYTIALLRLNDRDNLVAARRAAAHYYLARFKDYVDVGQTTDFATLNALVQDPMLVDDTVPFDVEKARIRASLLNDILTYAHPTVWLELKRQRNHLPRTKQLFDLAPEALNW